MKEILIKIRELLSDPKRWTQGCFARNCFGNEISSSSSIEMALNPNACSFCLGGAWIKVTGENKWDHFQNIIEKKYGVAISKFNDTRTHDEVLKMLDETIAEL